jgi:hypothetical protein
MLDIWNTKEGLFDELLDIDVPCTIAEDDQHFVVAVRLRKDGHNRDMLVRFGVMAETGRPD